MQVDYEALRNADPDGLYLEALAPYDYMMTPREVGELIGQSQQAVTGYLRSGSLGGVKLGNAWRIPKKMLVEYLYAQSNDGSDPAGCAA